MTTSVRFLVRVWLGTVVLASVLGGPAWVTSAGQTAGQQPSMTQAPPTPEGYEPVGNLPARERLPAAPFVLFAYGFVWVAILAYLWSLWRRLSVVEKELADVTRRVAGGRRRE